MSVTRQTFNPPLAGPDLAGLSLVIPWATETARGLECQLQVWRGDEVVESTVLNPDRPRDRKALAATLTERAGISAGDTEAALLVIATQLPLYFGKQNGHAPKPPKSFPLTDLGNAELLILRHGDDLRYCHVWGKWLVWDGRRWATDDSGEVYRRAKLTVRQILADAATIDDDEERRALVSHARRSESRRAIEAMVALAESEPGVGVTPDVLDGDPRLLTVLNGTLSLETGELRPHDRADMITRLAPVEFDPSAECPTWNGVLERILPAGEVQWFVQKAAGYTLTGHTSERVAFVLHGSGANGKSTLFSVLSALLGDYARRTPTETLLAKRENAIPNDIARLKGTRFAYASEAEEGQRLAEALVKDLTGGDAISARFMRGEWFDFTPEFKLWLGTNHRPVIRGTDRAIWDRLRLIPFEVVIPPEERIPRHVLYPQLLAELSGILNWALTGCLAWQLEGLKPPGEVVQATDSYRSEMDVLGEFLADACELTDELADFVTTGGLYQRYTEWCQQNGEKPMSQRALGLRLQERGCVADKAAKGKRIWRKIKWVAGGA